MCKRFFLSQNKGKCKRNMDRLNLIIKGMKIVEFSDN